MKYLTLRDAVSAVDREVGNRKIYIAVFNKKFIFKIYFGAGEMAQHLSSDPQIPAKFISENVYKPLLNDF